MSTDFNLTDTATAACTFKVNNTLANPTAVFADVYPPDAPGFTVAYPDSPMERPSTGLYELPIDCNAVGRWKVVWRSTGTGKGSTSISFNVKEP